MTELTTIEFVKELYSYFNCRGLLDDKNEKERIDNSVKRSGRKIGKKVDDIIDTIFESEIKEIIKNEKYRKKMKKNMKKGISIYNTLPSNFKIKKHAPLYMALISFIGIVNYLVDTNRTDIEITQFIPYKSSDEKKNNSTIKSIFKWFENQIAEKNIWSEIDNSTLAGWFRYNKPEIISNHSIINLKNHIKRDYEDINKDDLELLGVLLFFGRVIWSCYIEIKKKFPMIETLGYIAFINLNSEKITDNKKNFDTTFLIDIIPSRWEFIDFIRDNLFYKDEPITIHVKDNKKLKTLLQNIYNSSDKYKQLEKTWKEIKTMIYSDLKKWFKELNLDEIESGIEKTVYSFIFNFIYFKAIEEKDKNEIKKLENELEYKYKLGFISREEFNQEIISIENLTLEILELVIGGKIEVIISEKEIMNWIFNNSEIKLKIKQEKFR